jgi:hypothetical protein
MQTLKGRIPILISDFTFYLWVIHDFGVSKKLESFLKCLQTI